MNHEHSQKDKFVKLNGWGKPKGHSGGQPKGFAFLYKYRRVRGNRGDFLPERFVRTCCKKNYFLLQ